MNSCSTMRQAGNICACVWQSQLLSRTQQHLHSLHSDEQAHDTTLGYVRAVTEMITFNAHIMKAQCIGQVALTTIAHRQAAAPAGCLHTTSMHLKAVLMPCQQGCTKVDADFGCVGAHEYAIGMLHAH